MAKPIFIVAGIAGIIAALSFILVWDIIMLPWTGPALNTIAATVMAVAIVIKLIGYYLLADQKKLRFLKIMSIIVLVAIVFARISGVELLTHPLLIFYGIALLTLRTKWAVTAGILNIITGIASPIAFMLWGLAPIWLTTWLASQLAESIVLFLAAKK